VVFPESVSGHVGAVSEPQRFCRIYGAEFSGGFVAVVRTNAAAGSDLGSCMDAGGVGLGSGSRAGAILLLAEAGVILAITCRPRAAVRFAILAAALAGAAGAGTLAGRFTEKDPWRYRREMAASTVAMIAEHPWRGFGLGTYVDVYPAYATFDLGARVEHAHNQWLEWAAEGGIPLALVWLALALRISAPAVRSVWAIGIVAGFVHGLVDYPLARFGLTAWNFALLGALSAGGEKSGLAGPLHHGEGCL
jgi:O-antigen ligase